METLFIFSTLPRTKVKWYRISQREGPKWALQALSGVQSRWSYFICKDEGYTLKISPFSNWHIQLMKISLSLSCQADWILMLFWISTNLIQLLRSDAKLGLFSYKLYATKYSYLKNKVVTTKSTWTRVSALRTYPIKEQWELLHYPRWLPLWGTAFRRNRAAHTQAAQACQNPSSQSVLWEAMVSWELIISCRWTAIDIPCTFIGN